MTLDVVPSYGSCNLIKMPSFECSLVVFLQKNGSLCELRHRGLIAFLVVDLICYSLVALNCLAHGEDYGLEICGGTRVEVTQGKQWLFCQIKPIDRC